MGAIDVGVMDEIMAFIYREGYDSYSLLLRYAAVNRPDWCKVLRKRTIYVKRIMQSYARDVARGLEVPPANSPAWQRQQLVREREAARR